MQVGVRLRAEVALPRAAHETELEAPATNDDHAAAIARHAVQLVHEQERIDLGALPLRPVRDEQIAPTDCVDLARTAARNGREPTCRHPLGFALPRVAAPMPHGACLPDDVEVARARAPHLEERHPLRLRQHLGLPARAVPVKDDVVGRARLIGRAAHRPRIVGRRGPDAIERRTGAGRDLGERGAVPVRDAPLLADEPHVRWARAVHPPERLRLARSKSAPHRAVEAKHERVEAVAERASDGPHVTLRRAPHAEERAVEIVEDRSPLGARLDLGCRRLDACIASWSRWRIGVTRDERHPERGAGSADRQHEGRPFEPSLRCESSPFVHCTAPSTPASSPHVSPST